MTQMVIVNVMTAHRANVIANRTGSAAMGVVKAQMIDLLKEKLRNGVAHFLYMKKDGTLREAIYFSSGCSPDSAGSAKPCTQASTNGSRHRREPSPLTLVYSINFADLQNRE